MQGTRLGVRTWRVFLPLPGMDAYLHELEPMAQTYPLDVRRQAVDEIYAVLSPVEKQHLDCWVTINDGIGTGMKHRWVFLFLCIVARSRDCTPLEVASRIKKKRSAMGILLYQDKKSFVAKAWSFCRGLVGR